MSQPLDKSGLLELVFEHYDLTYPNGYGQKTIKCPVHDDANASATVNTEDGVWFCFACSAGGDAYNLIMEREGIGFTDAAVLAQGILDSSGHEIRTGSGGKSRSGVPRKQGSSSKRGGYRPSWMDG